MAVQVESGGGITIGNWRCSYVLPINGVRLWISSKDGLRDIGTVSADACVTEGSSLTA